MYRDKIPADNLVKKVVIVFAIFEALMLIPVIIYKLRH